MKRLLLAMLLFAGVSAQLPAQTPTSTSGQLHNVLQCARANIPSDLNLREVRFTTVDQAGQKNTIDARIYATREKAADVPGGLLRATMQIEAPEALKGAAYLVRETGNGDSDDMYVYLPAVGRVRHVAGSFTDGALMGTKFSYFEFTQLINAFRDLTPQFKGTDSVDGQPVYVIKFTPLAGAQTSYTSVKAWFDKRSCLPLRADFSQGETIVKRLSVPASAMQKSGDNWYFKKIKMQVLADGSYSIMRVNKAGVDEPLSGYYFDPETFYIVR